MIYIAYPDGSTQELLEVPTLAEAREIVGGYVERVAPRASPDIIFLCNEDGFARRLPTNVHASELYGAGVIVGTVIVIPRARAQAWL